MKTYQVFIDVPQDEDWINIEVESMEVEAFDCWEAQEKANKKVEKIYDDFYVWEVTEDDIIMEKDQEVFMEDIMYLPIQYHKDIKKQPFFSGKGNLNVKELEQLCEDFSEYAHQQAVIKDKLKRIVIDLKFNQ